jgi:hypothetical protein
VPPQAKTRAPRRTTCSPDGRVVNVTPREFGATVSGALGALVAEQAVSAATAAVTETQRIIIGAFICIAREPTSPHEPTRPFLAEKDGCEVSSKQGKKSHPWSFVR